MGVGALVLPCRLLNILRGYEQLDGLLVQGMPLLVQTAGHMLCLSTLRWTPRHYRWWNSCDVLSMCPFEQRQ